MPVMKCQSDGKPGRKFGKSGKCYTYTSGDEASSEHAKEKAKRQGRAEHANKHLDNEVEQKHLDFNFEVKQVTESDDFYEFEGYGSTFDNIDRVNDVILKGAFYESIMKQTPAMLWQHDMTMPIGVYTEVKEDDNGLYVKGKMPKSDDFVSGRVIPQMKIGSVNKMSIGFFVEKASDVMYEKGIRYIKRLNLLEVSLVTIPANPKASVSMVKNLKLEGKELSFREIYSKLQEQVREFIKDKSKNKGEDAGNGNSDDTYIYVLDIFDNTFIYEVCTEDEEKLYQMAYTYDPRDNTIEIDEDPIEVMRQTVYTPVNGEDGSEESTMTPPPQSPNGDVMEEVASRIMPEMKNKSVISNQITINSVFEIKTKRDLERKLRESGLFSRSAASYLASYFDFNQSDSGVKNDTKDYTGILSEIKRLNKELE